MSKPRVLVELRPDAKLLDSQFDGYKLSLEPVPIRKVALPCRPDQLVPSADQYSFLHTKLFGLHNKLFSDPWTENIFYIDEKWTVYVFNQDSVGGGDERPFLEVWEVPSHHERKPGHYNLSLSFASPDLAVLSDGAGTLHVVTTGVRSLRARWEVAFSCEPIGGEKGFVLLNCRYYCGELHCLLLHVAEKGMEESAREKSRFVSVLDWITLEGEVNVQNWSLKALRQLVGRGSIDLAAFEPSCSAIFVASDCPLRFVSDSENPVTDKDLTAKVEVKPQITFSWLQKGDDVTIWIPLAPNINKTDIKVVVASLSIKITIQDSVVLEGSLHQNVDPDLTCWTVSSGKLEVTLSKSEFGVVWPELIVGCKQGEEIMDAAFVEEVHSRLAHLCSETIDNASKDVAPAYNSQELEDCDAFPRDTAVFSRLDAKDHTTTHQANLGGHQWLFNVNLTAGAPPAICVRHDVDACVWQTEEMNRDSNVWPISHVGTFLAFGYVQASKQQRKFIVCPADMSYVAICDASRHVYLYRQPSAIGSELRHRSSGRRVAQVAKQQLVQLESDAQMIGCQAFASNLFVLTEEALLKLVLKS